MKKKTKHVKPVFSEDISILISAGGKGTRLWPLSTKFKPKQFCKLVGDQTMLQLAYERSLLLVAPSQIFIGILNSQIDLVKQQLPDINNTNIIVEPESRDTAPAIMLATTYIQHKIYRDNSENQCLIVIAADQLIEGEINFINCIMEAVNTAKNGKYLVSIGVVPTEFSTQYGYMHCGYPVNFCVDTYYGGKYIEKPDVKTAKELVSAGSYLWNTNIFVWKISVLLKAFEYYQEREFKILTKITQEFEHSSLDSLSKLYSRFTKLSIDYALLEKVKPGDPFRNIFVKGKFGWADIGSFHVLAKYLPIDNQGNHVYGNINVSNVQNSILIADTPFCLHIENLKDLICVVSDGNVLLIPRQENVLIKEILAVPLNTNIIKSKNRFKIVNHDNWGNIKNTFVRLLKTYNCYFYGNNSNIICAANLNNLSVKIKDYEVNVIRNSTIFKKKVKYFDNSIQVMEDYDAMSELAAEMLVNDLKKLCKSNGRATLVISAGTTPTGLYKLLRKRFINQVDWKLVTLFQMDEYIGLSTTSLQSFAHFITQNIVKPLGIERTFFLNDELGNLAYDNLVEYDKLIEREGGIDIIVHGIGENAHLGFNEPGSSCNSKTRITKLDKSTIKANSRFF